jgi:hypothetical protein
VIACGEPVPPVRVWIEPDDRGDGLTLDTLSDQGAYLLLFYLYDWTGT